MAQRKRAGPITQRSVDRNHPLLRKEFSNGIVEIGIFILLELFVYALTMLYLDNKTLKMISIRLFARTPVRTNATS